MQQKQISEQLNILTHRSVGWLLLLGIAAMLGFAWTDRFLVPDGSRLYWLATRATAAAFFAALFLVTKQTAAGRYSPVYAHVGTAICVATIIGMNIVLGDFPSQHYAAIILIVAAQSLVTWSAKNTFFCRFAVRSGLARGQLF